MTPEHTTSPYVGEVVAELEARGWQVDHLTLRGLLGRARQLVHIQWPEHVSRGATTPATIAKHARAVAIAFALDRRDHRVVLTAHNLAPHGDHDRFDDWFRHRLFRRADAVVVLVDGHEPEIRALEPVGDDTRFEVIPLPVLTASPKPIAPPADDAPLLMLGQIHPYHRVREFIDRLIELQNTRPLIVAGAVGDDELLATLRARASEHPWIELRPGYQSDDDVARLVERSAAAVSLQRNPFNSGAGPFALPRHLPVAMTDSAQTRSLADAVGAEWVFAIPQDLGTLTLASLETWLALGRTAPDLSPFSLSRVADGHEALYNSMAGDQFSIG